MNPKNFGCFKPLYHVCNYIGMSYKSGWDGFYGRDVKNEDLGERIYLGVVGIGAVPLMPVLFPVANTLVWIMDQTLCRSNKLGVQFNFYKSLRSIRSTQKVQ